jgi:hypothetical protein
MTLPRHPRLVPALALLLLASTSGAQTSAAIAESLFREGKKLLEQKRYDEACPKFKESARLDPSSGVELALGLCYEGQGRTASAWAAFVSAASLARRDARHDREAVASHHAAALEPKIPRVTLDVAPETLAIKGLSVKQDGIALESETWKGAPADPGTHALEASAPGKKAYSMSFTIGPGEETTVRIPALEDLPPSAPVAAAAPLLYMPPSQLGRQAGYVVGGAGAVTLVVGAVLGVVALHDASTAHADCPASPCTNAVGVAENGTAGTTADWSTGLIVVGGLAVVGGAALYLFTGHPVEPSSTSPTSARAFTPLLGPGFAGLSGRF